MNFTSEQLRELSDAEISILIANYLRPDLMAGRYGDSSSVVKCGARMYDFCNNPNDIMPIAKENKIGILFSHDTDKCAAQGPFGNPFIKHENNYMRAACEVFILMKQESE